MKWIDRLKAKIIHALGGLTRAEATFPAPIAQVLHYDIQTVRMVKIVPAFKLADDDLLLLSIGGTLYFIADIGLRMLSPRELYNAMGFPPDYIIDRDYMGNPYPKNEQVARCGNAVCPPMAAAVARANFPEYVAKVGDTITTMAALLDMVAV